MDELGLNHGACRADIAVVNGKLIGYEIKSETDSLLRLKNQIVAYDEIFDSIFIITSEKHLPNVIRRVPKHWGIFLYKKNRQGDIQFYVQRKSRLNPRVNALSVARLLWKTEAAEILQKLDASPKLLRSPRCELYNYLSQNVPLKKLKRIVRTQLKRRKNWRHRLPLFGYDGSFRPTSKSLDSLGI